MFFRSFRAVGSTVVISICLFIFYFIGDCERGVLFSTDFSGNYSLHSTPSLHQNRCYLASVY